MAHQPALRAHLGRRARGAARPSRRRRGGSSRSSARARPPRSRSAGCSSGGRAASRSRRRAGGRQAALRRAAERVETALSGLRASARPVSARARGRRARGPVLVRRPRRRRAARLGAGPEAGRRARSGRRASRRRTSSSRCSCGRSKGLADAARIELVPDRSSLWAGLFDLRENLLGARARRPARPDRRLAFASGTTVRLTVVGSINLDLVARAERLPRPGETVTGATFGRIPGGKGANQAVAAARLGADVDLIACVGDDEPPRLALAGLQKAGVRLDRLKRVEAPTGVAIILVDDDGENVIVVAPGANLAAAAGRPRPGGHRRRALPARDPARDGRTRLRARARRLLPQRRAGARPLSRPPTSRS